MTQYDFPERRYVPGVGWVDPVAATATAAKESAIEQQIAADEAEIEQLKTSETPAPGGTN